MLFVLAYSSRPKVIIFSMLNSVENEILNTHKYVKISRNSAFLGSKEPRMLFFSAYK